LSPATGHVTMNLTVTGRGFPPSEDVTIMYGDYQVQRATTSDQGSFEVSFATPASKYGQHEVRVNPTEASNNTADLETIASAVFTMESDPPPVPTLILPPNKSRVGVRGSVTPTLEWSEVFDDSGVAYYRLQISTSADVTDTGFTDPLISKDVLTVTSYTLQEGEALPLGTYYWIVQAVDGAENGSGWSANHSFRVGLLPLWGLIAAIVGGALLLIVIIRALVRRHSIYYDGW